MKEDQKRSVKGMEPIAHPSWRSAGANPFLVRSDRGGRTRFLGSTLGGAVGMEGHLFARGDKADELDMLYYVCLFYIYTHTLHIYSSFLSLLH